MKTLIVIQCTSSGIRELRITCARFYAQSHESRSLFTLTAMDADSHPIAVLESVEEAYFEGVVTFQSVKQPPEK